MYQFKSQEEVDKFHNDMRIQRGLQPLPSGYHVVQIVEGLVSGCGCQVTVVVPSSHYAIYHHDDCYLSRQVRREVVQCTAGQAVCSTQDKHTKALMRLDLPWPHELWKGKEEHDKRSRR